MIMRTLVLALFATLASATSGVAEPKNERTIPGGSKSAFRFCVVPVLDGAPNEAFVNQTFRMVSDTYSIPGLPAPVFTQPNGARWTISSDRRFVPYDQPFPYNYFDKKNWVFEPWDERVVATVSQFAKRVRAETGTNLFILKPGARRFTPMDTEGKSVGLASLPTRKLTAAIDRDGSVHKVGLHGLEPWLRREDLEEAGIPGIQRLFDAPALTAIIAIAKDNSLLVLDEQDHWHRIGQFEKKSVQGPIFDAPESGLSMLIGRKLAYVMTRRIGTSGRPRFMLQKLTSHVAPSRGIKKSYLFGQVLRLTLPQDGSKWQRLSDGRFVDIAGGAIGNRDPKYYPGGRLVEGSVLGRMIFYGRDGLYLYDGKRIYQVPDSGRGRLGPSPIIVNLPSIGRAVVVARTGLYDLSQDGSLTKLDMPFPTRGLPRIRIADWPESKIAIASTASGLFAIDSNLDAFPIQDGKLISKGNLRLKVATVRSTGELLLKSSQGLFLVADRNQPGSDICDRQLSVNNTVTRSDICVLPVPGSTKEDLGFAIGASIPGPTGKGLLLSTVRGPFHLDENLKLTNLQERTTQYTRNLVRLPWSNEVMVIGTGRNIIVRKNLTIERSEEDRQSGIIVGLDTSLRGVVIRARERRATGWRRYITGGEKTVLLTSSGGNFGEIQFPGRLRRVFDTPWWGGALADTSNGFQILKADGSLEPFQITGAPETKFQANRSAVSHNRIWRISDAMVLPRFASLLLSYRGNSKTFEKGWYIIATDRVWRHVTGLPPDTVILTTYDSGEGGILLGTDRGVFRFEKNGTAILLRGESAPARSIRAIEKSPDGKGALAGGDEGLFKIPATLETITPWRTDMELAVGSVHSLIEAEKQGLMFVRASLGSFLIDGQMQFRKNDALAPSTKFSDPIPLPNSRRMFVLKRRAEMGPKIFQLGKLNANNVCSAME